MDESRLSVELDEAIACLEHHQEKLSYHLSHVIFWRRRKAKLEAQIPNSIIAEAEEIADRAFNHVDTN